MCGAEVQKPEKSSSESQRPHCGVSHTASLCERFARMESRTDRLWTWLWMLSCVLYSSICRCFKSESFPVYPWISFLHDNKILLWWHQKLLYWSALCSVWGVLSLGKQDMSSHISDSCKDLLFPCRHRYIPVFWLVPQRSKGMLTSYGLPILTVLVKVTF